MTVSNTDNRQEYAGNGITTLFAYPNKFFANADLVVELLDEITNISTVQVLDSDYTVAGAGLDAGGTVTMIVPPTSDEQLIIFWDGAATQGTDYVENDPFPAESHETALDKLTRLVQRSRELLTRSIKMSNADTSGASLEIPPTSDPLNRALQFLQFDANGDLTVGSVVNDIGSFTVSALDIANAIVQRDGSGNFAANIGTFLKVISDVAATNGTVVLAAGTDGTDAVFTGDVVGNADTATKVGVGATVLNVKTIDIGDWDMDATTNIFVVHGLSDITKIRSISVIIRNDTDNGYSPLSVMSESTTGTVAGGVNIIGASDVALFRQNGSLFDSVNYDSTSYNRGWVTIWYID